MHDNTKMLNVICEEIDKIADKGLTTGNLDTAYKLVDMYKDLKTVEGMEEYPEVSNKYMRHYSNAYGRDNRSMADYNYSQAKREYRYTRDMSSRKNVMDSLEQKMRELRTELKEMSKDSDFPEEREKIDKYVEMIDRVM